MMKKDQFIDFDAELLTWEESIEIERANDEKKGVQAATRAAMARCMVDEKGNQVPFEDAKRFLGSLSMKEVSAVSKKFQEAMLSQTLPQIGGEQ